MAKKISKKKNVKVVKKSFLPEIMSITFVAFSFYYIASMFTDKAGAVGNAIKSFTLGVLSVPGYIMPFVILILGTNLIIEKRIDKFRSKYILAGILMLTFSAVLQLFTPYEAQETFIDTIKTLYLDATEITGGGVLGGLVTIFITKIIGSAGAGILYFATYAVCVTMLFNVSILAGLKGLFNKIKTKIELKKENKKIKPPKKDKKEIPEQYEFDDSDIKFVGNIETDAENTTSDEECLIIDDMYEDDMIIGPDMEIKDIDDNQEPLSAHIDENSQVAIDVEEIEDFAPEYVDYLIENYEFPPITLLKQDLKAKKGVKEQELMSNARKLVDTLNSFGVSTKVLQVSKGPAITRYELQPMAGVKVSKIVNLTDDIALNLAAPAVRIEAPIPGKAAIGIEVPNSAVDMVSMREVIDSDEFKNHPSKLAVALGKDISGSPVIVDLAKMPHLLIAGATGSGKSVCINSIITSIMYKANPNEVKLILIDPKVVELSVYNGIPHLDTPVVTKAKKAAGALSWAVTEMMKRYDMFSEAKVRDIKGYNEYIKDKGYPQMPQIVIIIDELADLMMVAPNEVEDSICRLAQLARAAGMHLIIATQRPSVNVITGIIKANIPSRIAFAVSSQIDSRTILDMSGAEKLLGRGDMLYHPYGSNKPQRIQGAFVSDSEVESLVKFVKENSQANYNANIAEHIELQAMNDKEKTDVNDSGDNDELLPKAIDIVMELGQASTSTIQRKLSVGYARAGRIMDQMENRGIVGPPNGSKPREIRITKEQYLELKNAGIFEEPIKY